MQVKEILRVKGNRLLSTEPGGRAADAVRAVHGLGLDGWIPPGIEDVDVVGRGEVEPLAARLEADQEQPAVGVLLEALHPRLRHLPAQQVENLPLCIDDTPRHSDLLAE